MNKFDTTQPKIWVRIWAALAVGTMLGSYVVPVLKWKTGHDSGWSDACQHGWDNVRDNGIPTVLFLTVIFAVMIFIVSRSMKAK